MSGPVLEATRHLLNTDFLPRVLLVLAIIKFFPASSQKQVPYFFCSRNLKLGKGVDWHLILAVSLPKLESQISLSTAPCDGGHEDGPAAVPTAIFLGRKLLRQLLPVSSLQRGRWAWGG